MRKRLATLAVLALTATPLLGGTANAGVVCGVAETVYNKYVGPIAGHYGEIEDAAGTVCSITP